MQEYEKKNDGTVRAHVYLSIEKSLIRYVTLPTYNPRGNLGCKKEREREREEESRRVFKRYTKTGLMGRRREAWPQPRTYLYQIGIDIHVRCTFMGNARILASLETGVFVNLFPTCILVSVGMYVLY